MGHTVLMGRRTWESLPARFRPLPGRRNVVLTRNPHYEADGAEVITSLDEALSLPDLWVIGGSEIYHLALPAAAGARSPRSTPTCTSRTRTPWRRCSAVWRSAPPARMAGQRFGAALPFISYVRL